MTDTCSSSAFDYVVVGNPVAHSKSPHIHALFAQSTGQALSYGKLLAPLDAFVPTVQAFRLAGGRGCNVTVPFKQQAHDLADIRSERAQLAGAVNTLRFEADGRIFADNTDGVGLVRDIQIHAQRSLAGLSVLLLGAGGAAAGAMGELLRARPARLRIHNRTADKALQLVARHDPLARASGVDLCVASGADLDGVFDVVINSTSSSLGGAAFPVGPQVLGSHSLVVDMMYGPAAEPALQWVRSHGAQARDGFGMLVEQAAEAFHLWRGVRPDTLALMPQLRRELVG